MRAKDLLDEVNLPPEAAEAIRKFNTPGTVTMDTGSPYSGAGLKRMSRALGSKRKRIRFDLGKPAAGRSRRVGRGDRLCACGRVISANKKSCFSCSTKEVA